MPISDTTAAFPSHQIDPLDKGFDWIIQYIRAAFNESKGWMPYGQLNFGNLKMQEIKMYAMGKQSVDKYKKQFSPGNPSDESWRSIDWTPPAFMCKFREIALAKLLQKKFDIQPYATDPLAVSEEDMWFNQMKVKILMREEARKFGSELADSPALAPQPGEPEDLDALMMEKEYGYKHEMTIQAEDVINLIFQRNDLDPELRKRLLASLYDYGIGALTQELDENGMVKQREINMEYFGSSYFEKPDGSDMTYWFEVVPTFVGDLVPYYTKEQLDNICKLALNKNGNPNVYTPYNGFFNKSWNRFKVMVCKMKFLSWNDYVYKKEKDNRDNIRFGRTDYQNSRFAVNTEGALEESTEGKQVPTYLTNCKKVSYKGSWIIDTDFMHDWGMRENQNRKLSSWWDTDLDLQLYAWNFHRMQFTGITERLMPFEDRACMAWFNLQNLSNKLIPYLINLDMNAVEGAFPFGKGGQKGKPSDVIDFIFSNFIVPYRSTDLLSRNPNYKPVSIEATGQLGAFSQLYDQLTHTLEMMRQVSGLNELTDASTPNSRTLVPVAEAGIQATNNAIFLVSEAEKNILLRTADAVIQKVQIAVQLGKIEGYVKALGANTVKFLQISPDIALHEFGIFIEDAPTEEQRQMLWQDISMKESQGLLTVGDKAFVLTVRNFNQAYKVLDYKIKKRQEELRQFDIQKIQEGAAANGQQNQMQEEMKQETIGFQLDADLILLNATKQWEYEIESMKKQTDLQGEMVQAEGRNIGHQIQSQAKIIASSIAAEASVAKQQLANKKPKTPSKAK